MSYWLPFFYLPTILLEVIEENEVDNLLRRGKRNSRDSRRRADPRKIWAKTVWEFTVMFVREQIASNILWGFELL